MILLSYFDAGALAFLPFVLQILAIWFLYVAYKASRSNSTTQTRSGTIDNTGNMPLTKTGQFVFYCILQGSALVSFYLIFKDYQ